MDEISDEDLRESLRSALEEAAGKDFESVVTIAGVLRHRAAGPDDPLRAVVAALEYHLVLDPGRRDPYGPFGPMIESGGTAYPAPVDQIDTAVFPLWARALDAAPLALLAARFADLLWEGRYGDRAFQWAARAIDSYLAATEEGFGHSVELSEGVQRALELAAHINDQSRHAAAVRASVQLAQSALDNVERVPGVALTLIEVLARQRLENRPPELGALLEQAIDRYGDDPFLLESALDIQARLVDASQREPLRVRQVEAFAELARRSTGLVKYAHFQHAIELAEEHGLRGLADRLRREVELLPVDELDLKSVSAEVQVPREEIDRFIASIVGDDGLEAALARFGAHIPSGLPDQNREFVRQLMADHPVQFLFTRMTIGPENSLLQSVQGAAEQEDQALIDHELQRVSIFSLFAVDILDHIRARYGPLAAAGPWFESPVIEPAVATRIARAIELYEAEDFDSAASVLAPRLERIVRCIARVVGLTVTKSPDRQGRSGGVKGLGELLRSLQGSLDEATRRYLRVLLSEVTGLNLRNRVGHGLVDDVSQREAALLIHAACHLRLLGPRDDTTDDAAPQTSD